MSTVALGPGNVWELGGTDVSGGNGTTQAPVIIQWRGAKGWTGNVAPSGVKGYVGAASADSASDIWAVTSFTGTVLHYNGTRWSVAKVLPNGSAGLLSGVVATSPKNVWVFGNSGFGPGLGTWHFNGSTWRHETTAALGDNIGGASAVNGSNIWGVGASSVEPAAVLEHFNGSAWTPVSNPLLTGRMFGSIHAFSATSVWASAQDTSTGPTFLLHYSGGGHWSQVQVPWGYGMRSDIVSDGHGGLWFMAGPLGSPTTYSVHLLAGNTWQKFLFAPRGGNLAHIPGTTSVVGAGYALHTQGSNAVVWVIGSL